MTEDLRDWYPARAVYKQHQLKVSNLHTIYIEECGNPLGYPVIWCHGGPGSGLFPNHGRQFDPAFFRLILFSQRGCFQSTPFAETKDNETSDLIADMEKIRQLLGIDKWVVAGRSWGATLALLYAEAHPDRTTALFCAAVFLCDQKSNQWLFQSGASEIYPEAWAAFEALINPSDRHDMFQAYHRLMFGADETLARKAAEAWALWEAHTMSVRPDEAVLESGTGPDVALALGRLECHYLSQGGFIDEGQILRDASKIAHIPIEIVHGRYDMNTTFSNALKLHHALPISNLVAVPLGGHVSNEPTTVDAQVRAGDRLKTHC